jgi:hypothetical protein
MDGDLAIRTQKRDDCLLPIFICTVQFTKRLPDCVRVVKFSVQPAKNDLQNSMFNALLCRFESELRISLRSL